MSTISVNRPRTAHVRAPRPRTLTGAAPVGTPRIDVPHGIPVLPAVDVNFGAVTFVAPNGYQQRYCAETPALLAALATSVRSPLWVPEISTLVVTVAQTGSRAGRRLGFRLEAF